MRHSRDERSSSAIVAGRAEVVEILVGAVLSYLIARVITGTVWNGYPIFFGRATGT